MYELYITPLGYICSCGDVITLGRTVKDLADVKLQAEKHVAYYHAFLNQPTTVYQYQPERTN